MRSIHIKGYRIFLVLIAVLVVITLGFAVQYDMNKTGGNKPAAQYVGDTPAAMGYAYLLKEYDGRIGVYRAGENAPFRVLDVYLTALPVIDRTELEDGMYIQNEEKLQGIIEDYES